MQAIDLREDVLEQALQWDSARQHRLQQKVDAVEPEPRTRLQLVDPSLPIAPPWQDKLQAIPAMRSALIALAVDEGASWSKPFTLTKADFEPWLAFYAGYCNSRLFLHGRKAADGKPELDYPLRALLQLRRLDPRLIVDPPVQIDGPVTYFDAARAGGNQRDPGLAASLARAAEAMHRSQLKRAFETGSEMGNALHDALLGEGLAHLIRAWELAYQRKPTPHELHIMLTTGRTTPVPVPVPAPPASPAVAAPAQAPVQAAKPAAVPASRPPRDSLATTPAAAAQQAVPEKPATQRAQAPAVLQADEDDEPVPFARKQDEGRAWWWYMVHAVGLTGAGALLYILLA